MAGVSYTPETVNNEPGACKLSNLLLLSILNTLLFIVYMLYLQIYLLQTFPAAEGFIRGRSYNIRMDDHVLLRFSPRNSDSTYYFSDMVTSFANFYFLSEFSIHTPSPFSFVLFTCFCNR